MNEIINLQHGGGGEESDALLTNIIFKHLGNPILNQKHDGAFFKFKRKNWPFQPIAMWFLPSFLKVEI